MLGTSRWSRLARLFDEGIGAAVVQDSGPIDVHMVTHDEAGGGLRLPALHGATPQVRKITGWAMALLLPLTATGLGLVGVSCSTWPPMWCCSSWPPSGR
ncbi:MAG: hypothetical protein ACRDTE_20915 [Pseudonocardiaceae bacterium]